MQPTSTALLGDTLNSMRGLVELHMQLASDCTICRIICGKTSALQADSALEGNAVKNRAFTAHARKSSTIIQMLRCIDCVFALGARLARPAQHNKSPNT